MEGLGPCICIFIVAIQCFMLLVAAQITDPSEVSALLSVKGSLVDNLKHLRDWKKGDPCTSNWTGVFCYNKVGADGYLHVRELHLMNKKLSGSLAPELGQLSHLQILNFMWNDLTGSIPKEIGNIIPLRLLLLNGNQLSGSLADELGYLSNLNRFQIDENQISGAIPKSFSNLNRIRHIHFNNNSLSDQIPHELYNLSSLLHLLLDNNNLSGYLPPEFSAFPDLQILQLDNNNFSGSEIPASYGNLSSLVKLSLRNCFLQGSIPDLSSIENLSYLILSHNRLNGSVPKSFSLLSSLQKLSLENNFLDGSVPTDIWQNKNNTTTSRLLIDLRNNSISNIFGAFDPPPNVTLRFQGNPVCGNSSVRNNGQLCGPDSGADDETSNSIKPGGACPVRGCPTDNYYEYVPASPEQCFCASPIRIGYRLKSPSISYVDPYKQQFQLYVTSSLHLDLYQLLIDSYIWEKGPRLRMHLKLFPVVGFSTFNGSEVLRISEIFASWEFPRNELFGPYELLNFTLLGPYSYLNSDIQGKHKSNTVLIACLVATGVIATCVSTIVTILITRRRAQYQSILSRRRLSTKLSIKIDGVRSFTFRETVLATNSFDSSTQVGEGGYGSVFRGILADKTVVAIKRAKEGSLQGQKEFLTEIQLLSRLHHRNLVSLVGYCDEEGEQMLVYEFMPNGTLRDWLCAKSRKNLKFRARLQIALGAAKGILYLHTEADPPIFHRDIKASNILLDSKLTAKVADFGLSRLAPVQDDEGILPNHVSTMVKGTPGYLDPEYFLTRKMTDKSDVYSLGVVFLEILTGMHPISHGKNIVREVNMAQKSGTMFSIMDSRMGLHPSECVQKFGDLALKCCHDKPEDRPSMAEVVRELETILHMTPCTDADSLDNKTSFGGTTSSSYSNTTTSTSRDLFVSSDVSGGDLISGVALSITPR